MQQLIGIAALERQLKALKILEEDEKLQNNNEICLNYQKYFEIMGDEISLQYGGNLKYH